MKRRHGAQVVAGARCPIREQALGSEGATPSDESEAAFDLLLEDGDMLAAGPLRIEVLATPGHTPACTSYRIGEQVFVGDLLSFPGDRPPACGHVHGTRQDLRRSLARLLGLDHRVRFLPGHDQRTRHTDRTRSALGHADLLRLIDRFAATVQAATPARTYPVAEGFRQAHGRSHDSRVILLRAVDGFIGRRSAPRAHWQAWSRSRSIPSGPHQGGGVRVARRDGKAKPVAKKAVRTAGTARAARDPKRPVKPSKPSKKQLKPGRSKARAGASQVAPVKQSHARKAAAAAARPKASRVLKPVTPARKPAKVPIPAKVAKAATPAKTKPAGKAAPVARSTPAPAKVARGKTPTTAKPRPPQLAATPAKPGAIKVPQQVPAETAAKAAQASSPPQTKPAAKSATPRRKPAGVGLTPQEAWNRAMRNSSGPPIPYAMSREFETSQRIRHLTFGDGVVVRISSRTVFEAVFPDGPRKLLMSS